MGDLDEETAFQPAGPSDTPKAEITEAWGRLWAWACGDEGQRRDWDGPMIKAAMREAKGRNAAYRDVADTVYRLSWDLSARTREVIAELFNLNRAAAGPCHNPGRASLAALKAGNYATARQLEDTASVVPAQRTDGSPPAETSTEENR